MTAYVAFGRPVPAPGQYVAFGRPVPAPGEYVCFGKFAGGWVGRWDEIAHHVDEHLSSRESVLGSTDEFDAVSVSSSILIDGVYYPYSRGNHTRIYTLDWPAYRQNGVELESILQWLDFTFSGSSTDTPAEWPAEYHASPVSLGTRCIVRVYSASGYLYGLIDYGEDGGRVDVSTETYKLVASSGNKELTTWEGFDPSDMLRVEFEVLEQYDIFNGQRVQASAILHPSVTLSRLIPEQDYTEYRWVDVDAWDSETDPPQPGGGGD